MLATEEQNPTTPERTSRGSLLEHWPQNERMRHIPTIATMVDKLDRDLRRRIEQLWMPYADLPFTDQRHQTLELEFRALCRAIDRISDVARRFHRGHPHPPNELGSRIQWTINQAVASLNSVDLDTFGRRFPVQTFERSNSEVLWAAMLNVIQHVQRIVPIIREIEPDIDERLYEGLVQLREPLRREPIA